MPLLFLCHSVFRNGKIKDEMAVFCVLLLEYLRKG